MTTKFSKKESMEPYPCQEVYITLVSSLMENSRQLRICFKDDSWVSFKIGEDKFYKLLKRMKENE